MTLKWNPRGKKFDLGGETSLPLTTKGDILVHNGTKLVKLPVGADTQVLTADSGESSGIKWAASGSGVTVFLALNDTPISYSGQGLNLVRVNVGETALEFFDIDTDDIDEGSNLFYTDERVDDRVASLILDGDEIEWTYDDGSNTLRADVGLAMTFLNMGA